MNLTEKAENLSQKYNVQYSQVYDLMVYIDFKMLANQPLKKIFTSKIKNEEKIYALTDRYLRRQEYKKSQGTIKEIIPTYEYVF
jgi:hypothetical protein